MCCRAMCGWERRPAILFQPRLLLSAVGRAVSAEARTILFSAGKMVGLSAILGELTAPTVRALHTTIAADQTVIAVLAAIGLVLSGPKSRRMLNATVATDQTVISICATVWLMGWTRFGKCCHPPFGPK